MKLIKLLQDCGINPTQLAKTTRNGTERFYVLVPTEEQLTAVEALTSPIGERSNGTTYKLTAARAGSTYTDKFGRETSRKTNSVSVNPVATVTADDL
jgi:hypothetical protein